MNTCCNNIYPSEDMNRWESCPSTMLANADNYYTKAEIDEKLEDIEISGDCMSSGDVQNMIDASVSPIEGSVEALSGAVGQLSSDLENKADRSEIPSLSGYATQQWVDDKGYITQLKSIWGNNPSDSINLEYGHGLHNDVRIGSADVFVDINTDDRNSNYDYIIPHSLKPIAGRGEYDPNQGWVNGLFTQNGFTIGRWNYYYDTYDESEDSYLYPYFSIGNGTNDNNRHNIFAILENGKVLLEDGRILQNWLSDVDDVASRAASDVANKQDTLYSGWNIKTINGQSLLGSGNITISGGGSADLSNYYTKGETNDLLDNKLDASAYTPSDLSQYWTSAQTQSAIDAATQGKADASNVYNKSEVNNIVNNKFACMTQSEYDALATKDPNVLYLIHE